MSTCKYLTATHANDDVETLAQKSICNMKKKHANISFVFTKGKRQYLFHINSIVTLPAPAIRVFYNNLGYEMTHNAHKPQNACLFSRYFCWQRALFFM